MPSDAKCHIVSTGSYSDYQIQAVFLDRAEAEQYADDLKKTLSWADEVNDVEEMSLGRPENTVLVECFLAAIDLEDGEFRPVPPYIARASHEFTSPGQRCNLAVRLTDRRTVVVTSYISLAHAEKLCIEARQMWLAETAVNPLWSINQLTLSDGAGCRPEERPNSAVWLTRRVRYTGATKWETEVFPQDGYAGTGAVTGEIPVPGGMILSVDCETHGSVTVDSETCTIID